MPDTTTTREMTSKERAYIVVLGHLVQMSKRKALKPNAQGWIEGRLEHDIESALDAHTEAYKSENERLKERVKELELTLTQALSHGVAPELPEQFLWTTDEAGEPMRPENPAYSDGHTVMFFGADEDSHPYDCPELHRYLHALLTPKGEN